MSQEKEARKRLYVRVKKLVNDMLVAHCSRFGAVQNTVVENAVERMLVCSCKCCKRARHQE